MRSASTGESSLRGLLPLVLLFVVGAIAGGVSVAEWRQSPQPAQSQLGRRLFQTSRRARKSEIRRGDLRERLSALEAKLEETRRRTAQATAPVAEAAHKAFDSEAVMRYRRANDPEAYAARTNSIVSHAREAIKSSQEDLDLLHSVDTADWDPESRSMFEEYLELTDYVSQYENKLRELRILDPDLPAAYGYDAVGAEILRRAELQFEVRQRLMAEAAKRYGLSEEDAASLADVSYRVVETTLGYDGLRKERMRHERRLKDLERETSAVAEGGVR